MIVRPGAFFSQAGDGDMRTDLANRERASVAAGAPSEWATVRQVHGRHVVEVEGGGVAGEADGLFTTRPDLTLAVFTADCLGVVLHSHRAVGVAHAGWRGVDSGVVAALAGAMTERGEPPHRALLGPHIGSCCFEVGEEVAVRFPSYLATTTWGTTSVDLAAAVIDQLEGVPVERVGGCTRHQEGWFSHRRDATDHRLAVTGWRVG